MTQAGFSRRKALGLMGGASAAVATGALSSCSGGAGAGSGKLVMATVSEQGKIDSDAFYKKWVGKFTEQTGIEVELRTYPKRQYENSIQLLFTQGNPPDVFRSAGTGISQPLPYLRGWEHPLTDYVTDEWKSRWPDGSLDPKISGLHIGDDLYSVPFAANGAPNPMLTNMKVAEKYGISEPPKTWEELADAVLKVSHDSHGEVAGFYPITGAMRSIQANAGTDIDPGPAGINLQTGKSAAAQQNQIDMVEYFTKLNKQGGFVRGWQSEKAQDPSQMWSSLALGKCAFTIGHSWYYREVVRLKKDIGLTLSNPPIPESGRKGYSGYKYVFLPFWHMGAKTEQPEKAWKLLDFLSGKDIMLAYYQMAQRNPPALPRSVLEDAGALDKYAKKMFDVRKDTKRFAPTATMHGVQAGPVADDISGGAPKPGIGDMQVEAIGKPGKYDYVEHASKYDADNEKNIDKAVQAAAKKDKDVSRETFVFSDWNPMKDYQPEGVASIPDMWSA